MLFFLSHSLVLIFLNLEKAISSTITFDLKISKFLKFSQKNIYVVLYLLLLIMLNCGTILLNLIFLEIL